MDGELKIYLRLDGEMASKFLQIKDHLGVKNDTEAARSLINWYWREHREELRPTLEHFNLTENGVTVLDRELDRPKGKLIDVYFKPDSDNRVQTFCDYDQTDKCRHVDFALELPEVQEIFREKGWKPK